MPPPTSSHSHYPAPELIRDLLSFIKPYFPRFLFASFLRVAGDLAWLYPPYAVASLINFLTKHHRDESLAPLVSIFLLFALAILVRYAGQYYARILAFGVGERISLDAQLKSITHMFSLDISWHERENTGNKLKKIIRGGDSLNRIVRIWVNNFIEIIVNFIGITIVLGRFDTRIALVTLLFLLTYYLIAYVFRKRASASAQVVNAKEEDVQGLLFESVNNIRSVKVLGMGYALRGILERNIGDLFGKIIKRVFWFQTGNTIRALWSHAFRLSVMAYIAYGITQGRYELGFLLLFYGYFNELLQSVAELADITQDYVIAKLGIGRMMDVLKEPIGIDREDGKVSFPPDWKKISLSHVSFSYGGTEVLKDVSFEIMRGEKVGIIGLSGAGKSTLFKLLLKEHESYSGEIAIDDTSLRAVSKRDYFKHVACVLQETEVFNFSLRENITLANDEHKDDATLFHRALAVSHVESFLPKLPKGVDTLIGEKGIKLSGGERQRVGIARAIFKNPELLLLDEATSHLDIESEDKIRTSLHEFFQTVTAVVIAHRLTTIREMDRIIVIEDGQIVESGSFDELTTKKGRFFELWEKQKL